MKIAETTRRDIFDALIVENVSWNGRLEEPDFLARVFDLRNMPSYDGRFGDAYGDIWQHRVNNYDWDSDWVFHDSRLNLIGIDDEILLRFLCEMLHPVVRTDAEEVERLKQTFNQFLRPDGYEIVERGKIANRPVFATRVYALAATMSLESVRTVFTADANYVMRQLTRMETAATEDPDLAIGTAKELIETICRTILHERNIEMQGSPDLAQLVKQTTRELALTPDDIPEKAKAAEIIRRLLSNLATITQGISELRNFYGTGHGKIANSRGLQARHAKLAVGAASTLAMFLLETHQVRAKSAITVKNA